MMRMFLQVFVSIAFLLNLCGAFVLCNGPCSVKSKPVMSAVQNPWVSASDKVSDLRRILFESDELTIMPCCYDGLTARLVEQSGFKLTFMTGFGA